MPYVGLILWKQRRNDEINQSLIFFLKILKNKVDQQSCLSDLILILIGKVFKSSTSENKDWKVLIKLFFRNRKTEGEWERKYIFLRKFLKYFFSVSQIRTNSTLLEEALVESQISWLSDGKNSNRTGTIWLWSGCINFEHFYIDGNMETSI